MEHRRSFIKKSAGIAAILASGTPPSFSDGLNTVKVGQIGLGSHSFLGRFNNPPNSWNGEVPCKPAGIWDDAPGVAAVLSERGFGPVYESVEELTKNCDAVHVEYADYRRALELSRPALEAGKPVFINRPFTATIADAEEVVRLADAHGAPLMCASTLEFQPEIEEMRSFVDSNGPIRAYEAYCMEPHFTWHFPHVINYAHAALGGGVDTAYFTGQYTISLDARYGELGSLGCGLLVLNYHQRSSGEPPLIGMNHIGDYPGGYHIHIYTAEGDRDFKAGDDLFDHMFHALIQFYTTGVPPRPYEAILEQHRILAAANISRLTGREVALDSLGGDDSLPYSDSIRNVLIRKILG